jgi:ubiquinone/menaquinone biosynthesis C-methylase UbiE
MATSEMSMTQGPSTAEPRRTPHRCPWWGGPFLASPLRRLVESPEKLLGPHVEPGMRVLDFGPAMGFFSLPLARMVGASGRVLCLDVQPRMIAGLVRRARRAGLLDRIEPLVCGEKDLGLASREASFDLAVAIHVIHEVGDIQGTFDQLARALRGGGRMLLVEPGGHVSPELFEFELKAAGQAGLTVEERLKLRRRHGAVLRKPR